ncbi:MAG TPA: GFA family protein [Rhizomicrobium sp.]|nr:GFA family protein [Rhizomicrobium sp.]
MSHTVYPYQLCYCSICRKTDGGGGFAINIMGDARTLKVEGKRAIGIYHAQIEDEKGRCRTSRGERKFCRTCATALWVFDPEWPELVHPFASAIDTPLPVPPSKVHLMLKFKPKWVKPDLGPGDQKFQLYPKLSIEDWHRKHGLWID